MGFSFTPISNFTAVPTHHYKITKNTKPEDLNAEFQAMASSLGGYLANCLEALPTAKEGNELFAGTKIGDSVFDWLLPNSFVVQPMESWRGFLSQITKRKWKRFGNGGAGLIWNEATAVMVPSRDGTRMLGRANRNQLYFGPGTEKYLADLLQIQKDAHIERFDEASMSCLLYTSDAADE